MDFTSPDGPRTERVRALERANQVRTARAIVKRRIASGDVTAAEVILTHSWEIDGMSIGEILRSQDRWGSKRCREFLYGVAMRENKLIVSMTERQRTAVAALLIAGALTRRDPDRVLTKIEP